MKRTLPISLLVAFALPVMGQTVLINENFDSYSVGSMIAATSPANWSTWSAAPGGPEDAAVSNAYANSGANSLSVIATGTGGGTTDLLLKLGNKTTGSYTLSFWMYIPTGAGGYFNVQTSESVTPAQWALDMTFFGNGSIRADSNGDTTTIGSYPFDTWFSVVLAADMDAGTGAIVVNTTAFHTWTFDTQVTGTPCTNQLGSIDFFAYAGGAPTIGEYYIDDVLYTDLNVGIAEIGGAELSTYPNPATDHLYVEIPNSGRTPEVTLSDASGRVVAESRSFTSIGDALQLELDMSTLPVGVYTLRMNDGTNALTRKVIKG